MKILITGGAGYIGSILTGYLLKKHEVYVLDKFTKQNASLSAYCSDPNFNPIVGDVRDESLIDGLLTTVDLVIPLAALVGAPLCASDPINAKMINLDAIKLITGRMSKNQRVIYPTTNSGYGIAEGDSFCTEESPLNPISLYGQTKVDAENCILDSGNGITLRLATVIGMSPQMRLDLLVNDFVYRAFSDKAVIIFEGSFRRNYIHIRDVARAFVHCNDHYETMNNEPYNVGLSSANLTKIQLCAKIKEHVKEFVYIESQIGKDPDKRDYLVSNKKIEATGFATKYDLDKGIVELLKGYKTFKRSLFTNI